MVPQHTLVVFGGTGQTGRHLVRRALEEGHQVRAMVRDPSTMPAEHPALTVVRGDVGERHGLDQVLDGLLDGADAVVSMLGDAAAQRTRRINTEFVQQLVPAMRRSGVARFLYQAGGLSAPPGGSLPPALRLIRATIARGYIGQHEDNEAVMRHLVDEASDLEWVVHRAGIGGDGPSKGVLHRSTKSPSIATFRDCAEYDLRTVLDASAVHTCDFSSYRAAGTPLGR
ncbi:NAD(P)-dependent oxidoreductase [Curtobacterium sp. Leaf261]|uniref:NAD(P)-dependent oxidoreductase n=1 Tax=Curtobacterium sp. Leaf261 TaxID=1736311 RepID=UPI0006FB964B|nr:NAD(P)H-binding protein [Curtobacterium sp. Leaf261]KQO61552.1 NmrA family transcriptional regulator [Curtobacterium sp. Leaf261]